MRPRKLWIAFLAGGLLLHPRPGAAQGEQPSPASPRLAALREEVAADGSAALARFWQRVSQEGTPLVEPVAGAAGEVLVTFLWRGDQETRNVLLFAPPADLAGEDGIAEARLRRLPGTDVWYKSRRMGADARFGYGFLVNDSLVPFAKATPAEEEARWAALRPDPLNPRRTPELPSLAELPAAPKQPWIEPRPGVPAGRLEERSFASARLGNERIVRVYTPPGYDPKGKPYGLLILLDGRTYSSDIPTPTILDNLLAAGHLPPLVAVFVANPNPETRTRELSCHPPFAEFLARELLPWIRRGYRVAADPRRTVVVGSSLGGLAAACAAWRHSDAFGNVLALSGSFYWQPLADAGHGGDAEPEWLARQLATGPKLPLRFYLEAGLLEGRPRPEDRANRASLRASPIAAGDRGRCMPRSSEPSGKPPSSGEPVIARLNFR